MEKKKYTLVISDVEMNVLTDAPWESVEKIVGILDRKMRDIHLKSYRCTKNQAALLCALEYCAEKLTLQERNAELEEIAQQDSATIEQKEQRIAELEAEIARLQGENEIMHNILERAAASTERIMGHSAPAEEPKAEEPKAEEAKAEEPKAEEAKAEEPKPEEITEPEKPEAAPEAEPAQEEPVAQEAAAQEAPEQLSVDFEADASTQSVNTKAAQVIEEIADKEAEMPRVKAKKSKNRSRVGSMFDLLTFNDV